MSLDDLSSAPFILYTLPARSFLGSTVVMCVMNSNSFEAREVADADERLLRRLVDALPRVVLPPDVHEELPDVEPDDERRVVEERPRVEELPRLVVEELGRRRRVRCCLRRPLRFFFGSASPSFKPSHEQMVLMHEPCRFPDLLRRDRRFEARGDALREVAIAGCGIIRNSSATFSSILQQCSSAFATLAAGPGAGCRNGGCP